MQVGAATGCHQLPERSFFFKQYQFPVCARCCGALIGEILAFAALAMKQKIKSGVCLLAVETMFLDWFLQYIGVLKSTNARRFVSGILGGFGCWCLEFNVIKNIFNKIRT